MARSSTTIDVGQQEIFDVIVTPTSYPEWLVGARAVREVERDWPRPGSKFYHRVGIGPLQVPDSTVVVDVDAPRRLVLEVRARPVGRGLAGFTLHPRGDDATEVVLEEEPLSPVLRRLRPLVDPLTKARNDASLAALGRFVASRGGGQAQVYPFAFDGAVGEIARLVGAGPPRAYVQISGDELDVRFGPWHLRTPVSNVAGAELSGPYRAWRVAGPMRISLRDRGLTFASSAEAGVCVRFHEPVALAGRWARLAHPAVTVTVERPDALVAALQPVVTGAPVSKS